jgi:hypothetical protein
MCEELNPHGVVFRGCREPVDAGSLRLLGRRLAREARTDLHALSGLAVPVSAPLQDRKLA